MKWCLLFEHGVDDDQDGACHRDRRFLRPKARAQGAVARAEMGGSARGGVGGLDPWPRGPSQCSFPGRPTHHLLSRAIRATTHRPTWGTDSPSSSRVRMSASCWAGCAHRQTEAVPVSRRAQASPSRECPRSPRGGLPERKDAANHEFALGEDDSSEPTCEKRPAVAASRHRAVCSDDPGPGVRRRRASRHGAWSTVLRVRRSVIPETVGRASANGPPAADSRA